MNREYVYKQSDLPYSFCYKIRNAFHLKKCPVCNREMQNFYKSHSRPSIQHNIPISLGGKHEIENISVICLTCNKSLRDTITTSLNNEEVKKVWQTMLSGLK